MTSENDSASQDLDLSNPRSLLNLVSENLRLRIAEIPDEFLNRKEHEIINLCYSDEPDGRPGAIDSVLRRNFWDEYNRVLADELQRAQLGQYMAGHLAAHEHGISCEHPRVPHGDHVDYLVDRHLHHPHGLHCDDHGPLSSA